MRAICPKCGSTSVLIHDTTRNKCTVCGVVYSESDHLQGELLALAEIRKVLGCGDKPMASDLAKLVAKLKLDCGKYKTALEAITVNGWPLEMRGIAVKALAEE